MSAEAWVVAIAAAMAAVAWMVPRRVAGARVTTIPAVALDVLPFLLAGALLLTATGRPLFAGLVLLALGSGFALADIAKREALREPVVFSDVSELRHVFTHPHLYLPFAGPILVVGGALASVALGVGILIFTPALWHPAPLFATVAFLVAGADKASALAAVLEGRRDPDTYPSQRIAPTNGDLYWLVDRAAAAQLTRT